MWITWKSKSQFNLKVRILGCMMGRRGIREKQWSHVFKTREKRLYIKGAPARRKMFDIGTRVHSLLRNLKSDHKQQGRRLRTTGCTLSWVQFKYTNSIERHFAIRRRFVFATEAGRRLVVFVMARWFEKNF